MAKNIYIAQTSAGSDDGSSAANAHSVSWFNSSGNWGAGGTQISPGDTVHLCGTITSQLNPQASGSAGNLITFLWETNAKLSQAAGGLIGFGNLGYFRFDGGTNGIIENTDNGSSLGNQSGVSGIYSQTCTYIEVANLTFKNLYVHTDLADDSIDNVNMTGLYLGATVGLVVQNCSFTDVCWAIYASGGPVTVQDCSFDRTDHGIAVGTAAFTVQRCHFGSTANWDTNTNVYHHDGIHCYFPGGYTNAGPNIISECFFNGDWGANNTAHVFIEGDWNHDNPLSVNNTTIRNNVFVQDPSATHVLNDNFVTGGGHNWVVANNTFIGNGSVPLQGAASIGGDNVVFKNNLVIGVNTFVGIGATDTFDTGGCDYNLYVNWGPGGNSPYYYGPAPFYPSDAATGLVTWRSLSGQDAHSSYIATTSLAGINSDGTLASGSAAIGAGADLSALFTIDHNGTTRATPWDIGAYKYGAGGGGGSSGGSTLSGKLSLSGKLTLS